jgi:hypothetical protein
MQVLTGRRLCEAVADRIQGELDLRGPRLRHVSTHDGGPDGIGIPLGGLDRAPASRPQGHVVIGSKAGPLRRVATEPSRPSRGAGRR